MRVRKETAALFGAMAAITHFSTVQEIVVRLPAATSPRLLRQMLTRQLEAGFVEELRQPERLLRYRLTERAREALADCHGRQERLASRRKRVVKPKVAPKPSASAEVARVLQSAWGATA